MRARTHEQLERKNQLLFYCSKEDIAEMFIEVETLIDVLNYKIKILEEENKELKEELKNASSNYTKYIEERDLKINKAIEYIKQCEEYEDCCNGDEIIWILRGE